MPLHLPGKDDFPSRVIMRDLSIVVVTRNSANYICDCLQSILAQRMTEPVNVIVVDNASTDTTAESIRLGFPGVQLIANAENRGFNAANNQGIGASAGQFLLLLNPDTRLHDEALAEMLGFLRQHGNVAAIGPKILHTDGTLQRTGVSFPSAWNVFSESLFLDELFPGSRIFGRHRRLYMDPDSPYEVDYVQGSCIMLRRSALDEVGLLDESFFLYFDETDLCYRLRKRGWVVMYVPRAVITHHGAAGAAFYDEFRLTEFYRSYLKFLGKHYGPLRAALLRILLVWRSVVRFLVFYCAGLFLPNRRDEFRRRRHAYQQSLAILLSTR